MKLAKIAIENFRQLGTSSHPLEISFTDPMDRIRDLTVLVGPNSSGKTTILDAIGAAIGPSLEMPATRHDFKPSPPTVVRRGAQFARVTCWLRFSPDEVAATREFLNLADINQAVPDTSEVKLTWEYPDPRAQSNFGYTHCDPALGWTLLKERPGSGRSSAGDGAGRLDLFPQGRECVHIRPGTNWDGENDIKADLEYHPR